MKITGLRIDGFGVWSGLELNQFSEGINVFFGPNEAGKTTLMQFIRSVLYDFSPEGQRYLPPVNGGLAGGSVDISGASGQFRVSRHLDAEEDGGGQNLILTAADGTRQGEHFIKVLLCDVDRTLFRNVFAVGLKELQELGTLGDTDAAELLYRLTAGLDRVSLGEVMQALETSRRGLLEADSASCQITRLLAQREQLRGEIEELASLTRRFGQLASRRAGLDEEVTRQEEAQAEVDHQTRVVQLAAALAPRWRDRADLDDQLKALGPLPPIGEGAVERLDGLNSRLTRHEQAVDTLKQRHGELKTEAAGLGINEALWRQAARIEATAEQEPWIASLGQRVGELEAEIEQFQGQLTAGGEQLGLTPEAVAQGLPALSDPVVATLRPPARALRRGRQKHDEAQQQLVAARLAQESLSAEVESGLTAHGEKDLADAMQRRGDRVARLRRRIRLDERLDEMGGFQSELQQQARGLLDRQVLPPWILIGLGAVFVVGVVLLMAGLFMPASVVGSLGWALALLGLGGSAAAGATKYLLERSNTRQIEATQKQLDLLSRQIVQAKEERQTLDEQLAGSAGSWSEQLERVERELAALEELVPLDTRLHSARQEAETAAGRATRTESELAGATDAWHRALNQAGLPTDIAPRQIKQMLQSRDRMADLQQRLERRREELQQRARELDALTGRIEQLFVETGLTPRSENIVDQLQQLVDALDDQESRVGRIEVLRRDAKKIRAKHGKHRRAVGELRQQRRKLFSEAGVDDEDQLRQRAVQLARAQLLHQQRDAVEAEIAAALAGQCSEEAVAREIENPDAGELESRVAELRGKREVIDRRLQEQFEKRGELNEQLKTLADDRQLAEKQLDLAVVEQQLDEAVSRWQMLAATGRLLDSIRATYERERQPETLQEASGYLKRLTRGRYTRVWTPLGEDVLRVDDATGAWLPVEALSRGTREQLFLALRLALVGAFARRGAQLPIVLDDVLVNFDVDRAKAAAAVLRDFADAGHQLLVFTCHAHVAKLFKSLKLQVNELPERESLDEPVVLPAKKKKRRSKRRTAEEPVPVAVVTLEEPDEPEEDEVAEDDERIEEVDEEMPDDEEEEWSEDEEEEDVVDEDEEEEEYEEDCDEEEYDEEEDEYEDDAEAA